MQSTSLYPQNILVSQTEKKKSSAHGASIPIREDQWLTYYIIVCFLLAIVNCIKGVMSQAKNVTECNQNRSFTTWIQRRPKVGEFRVYAR